jgi:hypothetical protein
LKRVTMSRPDTAKAAAIGTAMATLSPSAPGAAMMTTPTNPATTADQRQTPTRSPNSGMDSAVTKIGAANSRVLAVASGRSLMLVRKR